ncbi:flavin reductase family protein [Vallitalea okinawensis]|uniref:flavin reductase family protein n=1 Tax=Vallitalea okinawensis TaxID=2078660 RepID=UPI000CFE1F7F|nr:flavin reductase family protein [Vallitalea okinawensis]
MIKKRVEYNKMYYGFPVILVAYYDSENRPNITTLSSSYSLGEMIVLGFGKNSYAVNHIKEGIDFTVNIPDSSMMKEIDICGAYSGHKSNKFKLSNLGYKKSEIINAPIIQNCPISLECTPVDVIENSFFESYVNILAKIKGRLVSDVLLDDNNNLIYDKIDSVEYLGDDNLRVYRYLDKNKVHHSKSFLKK